MTRIFLTATLLAGLSFTSAAAEIFRVTPFDHADKVPSFAEYRAEFLEAITDRDIPRMLEFVSPDVHLSFGGDVGHEAFVYFLTVPEESLSEEYRDEAEGMRERYWTALEEVLNSGGTFANNQTEFGAPYTWFVDLPEKYGAYETYFVRETNVPLHAERSGTSKVLARMDYEVLLLDLDELDGKPKEFLKVTRGNGQEGYVRDSQVRSGVAYRAFFERDGDDWTMVTFIAGD